MEITWNSVIILWFILAVFFSLTLFLGKKIIVREKGRLKILYYKNIDDMPDKWANLWPKKYDELLVFKFIKLFYAFFCIFPPIFSIFYFPSQICGELLLHRCMAGEERLEAWFFISLGVLFFFLMPLLLVSSRLIVAYLKSLKEE